MGWQPRRQLTDTRALASTEQRMHERASNYTRHILVDRAAMSDSAISPARGDASFEEFRPLLFALAYRMLGSVGDAEDIVQEAYLRLQRALMQGAEIASPKAFLTTVTTHLVIDETRSARAKHETYVGQWLPEPLLMSADPGPVERAEMKESLSMAFLVLLQTLSPVERAVFLLREVFDYGYDEIATIVGKSEDNCRQIFVRARKRIDVGKPRFDANQQTQREFADRFFEAVNQGNLDHLIHFLSEDATLVGDGGGKAHAYPMPLVGRELVARIMLGLFKVALRLGVTFHPAILNGQPGALALDADGRIVQVMALDIEDSAIRSIQSIVNPDKLTHLGYPVSDSLRVDRARD